jgi:hypothetical protein
MSYLWSGVLRRGMSMSHYYCYLLDSEGKVRAREVMEGADDGDAVRKARRYLVAHPLIPAVEVWFAERRVKLLTQLRQIAS